MALTDLQMRRSYRGDADDLTDVFYIPCLKESRFYCRAAGYFTSASLSAAASGLTVFLKKGGKMRFVASPLLNAEDTAAIEKGIRNREEVLKESLRMQLENVENELVRNRLGVLSWLIAEEILSIRIAFARDLRSGIYHEKMGLFYDSDGQIIAFSGSANETYGGMVSNFENIDVFCSFRPEDRDRVADKQENFESLWENRTPNLEVLDFTEVTWELLRPFRQKEKPLSEFYLNKKTSHPHIRENLSSYSNLKEYPHMPEKFCLFEHQKQAMKEWFLAGGRGILEMATGTGKTKTALSVAIKLYEGLKNLGIIIICPYKHLVMQWYEDCRLFGLRPVLGFESKSRWLETLGNKTTAFNIGAADSFSLITTNKTFQDEDMQAILGRLRKPVILIADEMHNLGAGKLRTCLPLHIPYRLGLSATPERHSDPEGTQVLFDYFGNAIFRFSLKEAIEKNILTPYMYYPHLTELTDAESDEYHELSRKIGRLMGSGVKMEDEHSGLKFLLIRRARLVAGAENKLLYLRELAGKNRDSTHNLFYCGDGSVEDEITNEEHRQVDAVVKMLGHDLQMRVHPFTAQEDQEIREQITRRFAQGDLQGLVAIRCLDEGVDIPSIYQEGR